MALAITDDSTHHDQLLTVLKLMSTVG